MTETCFEDTIQGEYHRWFIPFNFTMLRLVSFNMDYHWACRALELGQVRLLYYIVACEVSDAS